MAQVYSASARALRYLCEAIGTCIFFTVILVFGGTTYGAFAVGLALAVAILAFGFVGSYFFNPAVAVVLAVNTNKRNEYLDLPGIIVSEFIGGFAAYGLTKWARNLGYSFPTA